MATHSVLSKKRFQQIQDALTDELIDVERVQHLMERIKDIMNFDPTKSTYTYELGQKTIARRNKLRDEQGISTYITSGRKKHYENKKATSQPICT